MTFLNGYINIQLENGFYDMGFDGATGKTRLAKALREQSQITPKDVLVLTYNSSDTDASIIERIREFKGRVLFVDRFDLYFTDSIIRELCRKDYVVLIDLKSSLGWRHIRGNSCELAWTREGVRVCHS